MTRFDKLGRVWVLMKANQPSLDVIEDEFDKVFAVNVKSIFHVSSLPYLFPECISSVDNGTVFSSFHTQSYQPRGRGINDQHRVNWSN